MSGHHASSAAPAVSVVMAVRDDWRGLKAAALSVLEQREVAFEVVIVNDDSRDESVGVARDLAASDRRVRIVTGGGGLTRSLAAGCAEARAPYIARHDAADLSHPERLASQVQFFNRHPGAVLVSCWTACVGPLGEPLHLEKKGGETDRELDLRRAADADLEVGPTSHGSVVFLRSAYEASGGYRQVFALGQDWDLWLRLGERGTFGIVGRALYLRRLMPLSLSFAAHDLQAAFKTLARQAARARASGRGEEVILARAAALSVRFDRERAARAKRSEALGRYHLGSLLRECGDPRAKDYFGAAVRRRPGFARAWVRWIQSMLSTGARRLPPGFDSPEVMALLDQLRRGGGSEA